MKKTIAIVLLLTCLLAALPGVYAESGQAPIDEAAAKSAALAHAGLEESGVTSLVVKADREDGKDIFEVGFWNGLTEYDYDILATTGEILSFDIEVKGSAASKSGEASASPIGELTVAFEQSGISQAEATITPEDAFAIALGKANVSEAEVTITDAAIEYKAQTMKTKYAFEFTVEHVEYEAEIDAADGTILEYDFESEDD